MLSTPPLPLLDLTRLYAAFMFPRDIIVSNSISLFKFTSTSDSCDMPITVCTPAYSSDSVLSLCRQPFVFCISSVIGLSFTTLVYIRFRPSPNVPIFFRVLWLRLTSRSSLLLLAKRLVCENSPDKNTLFPPYACRIYPHAGLGCDFCPSGQTFAAGFLQITPHDGHHCPWLYTSRH